MIQKDSERTKTYMKAVISKQSNEEELNWINQQENILLNNFKLRSFYLTFSSASRFIRKFKLHLTREDLAEAAKIREGFQPEHWTLLQSVRIYFLLMLPTENEESYEKALIKLHEAADMDEQVALYSALPILPYADLLAKRAAEGIRTNITDVFDAIALHNPYPHDFLSQDAWNQMVLKAVFMQRPLYKIYGADTRANPELARMLVDFAHERWAAGRKVLPELWRFVGPFIDKEFIKDIEKIVSDSELLEKKAGLLACADSTLPQAQELLNLNPDFKKEIESGRLNWTVIGKKTEDDLLK
ncbi:EboA domain-containing protein [Zunongwangia sp. F260]|uniref:EboA domain-containing protein n=1 Tax=Autumnicola lenta TaxID=3075593 RepID=A0ABU3CP07_9FLAO|nr:EboA domain-containing protein [Zunongwangia sp. F260]MDT0648096.1 EboA domain-containing protein [Zunongwangia sp. F260]